jgi:hypothetical protein
MEKRTKEEVNRDYIEMESERYATAHFYQLDNNYLTNEEKLIVELWYQFPIIIMYISLCICMLYSTVNFMSLTLIIVIPIVLNLIVGLINWYIDLSDIYIKFFHTIGHNFVLWLLTFATVGMLIFQGLYIYAALIFLSKIGLIAIFSPSIYMYSILSRKYKMHPKWVFFKRFDFMDFPFEKEIEKPN